jgi:hypothetical protein
MTAKAKKLGTNFCICRNTNNYATPKLAPITACRNIKWNLERYMVDSADRSLTVNTKIPVRFKTSLEFDAIWDGSTALTALRTAFLAGTSIELFAQKELPTAGSPSGALGIRAEWCVAEFPLDFPLTDGEMLKIKLLPFGNYTNPPAFWTDNTTILGTPDSVTTKKLGQKASVNDSTHSPILAAQDIKFTAKPGALFNSNSRDTPFDTVIPTRFEYDAEFSFLWDESDTQLTTLQTAWQANPGNPLQMWILDGAYGAGTSWGLTSDFAIDDGGIDAQLRDGQKVTVKLYPHGNYTNPPTIVTV